MDEIRKIVEKKYAEAVRKGSCCCGSSTGGCCSAPGGKDAITSGIYGEEVLEKLPESVKNQSFGCGSPTLKAGIHPGEVVLDLGSGAGIDTFLAAERVGPAGRVFGLDMTEEMLETARKNAAEIGAGNITYIKGTIESIPLPDESVDVILSNCVINLSPDKPAVFREAFRVLRPGGRLSVSDMVFLCRVDPAIQKSLDAWAGCVAGAAFVGDLAGFLSEAGFEEVRIVPERIFRFTREELAGMFPDLPPEAAEEVSGALASASVTARRPVQPWMEGADYRIRPAEPGDLGRVEELLRECGLPVEGVGENLESFLVAEKEGKIIGSAGLEIAGESALLRSVASAACARKRRVAETLVRRAVDRAAESGARSVFLLTETAEGWFARMGFTAVSRDALPAEIRSRSALEGVCPASSTCMKLSTAVSPGGVPLVDRERIARILDFLVEIDGLKRVYRAGYLADGSRHESDAEHMWHLGMYALALSGETGFSGDVGRVLRLVLCHDLVELYAGDTYAYDEAGVENQAEREEKAARALFGKLPPDLGAFFYGAWREFEEQVTPEARFARALDHLQGFAQNVISSGKSWTENGITRKRTSLRTSFPRQYSQALAEIVETLYSLADEKGLFAPEEGS
ncbi:MAG: arsenite methyltransferase [Synergistaceae bacterium]|nr:arsenite methyltransferase [Synergistaceae bacterium]